jgi:hypothetical protein
VADEEARFLAKVLCDPVSGYWVWVGARNEFGYGKFWRGGRVEKAHRAALALFGPRPPKRTEAVLHRCDNPWCVRPDHLEPGPQARNCWDKVQKRRHHLQRDPFAQPRVGGKFAPKGEDNG